VAKLLNIVNYVKESTLNTTANYTRFIDFPTAVEWKQSLSNKTSQLFCNTQLRSDIGSCKGGWCPVFESKHDFLRFVEPILRNNSALSLCAAAGKGMYGFLIHKPPTSADAS
jgi:hypothetical protein